MYWNKHSLKIKTAATVGQPLFYHDSRFSGRLEKLMHIKTISTVSTLRSTQLNLRTTAHCSTSLRGTLGLLCSISDLLL